jgi:hypothetical protein
MKFIIHKVLFISRKKNSSYLIARLALHINVSLKRRFTSFRVIPTEKRMSLNVFKF